MTITEIHASKASENARQNDGYITVKNVSKYFERKDESLHVLDNISFSVRKGETVCIVGASGCGKSTLLRAIAGLDANHDGEVTVDKEQVTKPAKERGMVFQEPRLFPWLTVEQNVGYALNGVDREERRRLVKEHIVLVGLRGFEKVYPRQLSGGMAQRAGIARALVNNPSVLLLDEPFGALDTFTKISMQKELKRIQKQSKTTMLLVTHDIDEAVFLADRVFVMSARPGSIKRIIPVDLPEPRDRNSYEFLEIRKLIYNEFFDEEPKTEESGSVKSKKTRMYAG